MYRPSRGGETEELEGGPGHHDRVDVFGHITACDRLTCEGEGRYVLSGMCLAQLPDLRTGESPGSVAAGIVRNPDVADPVDPRIRPGMEHRGVQDAVDSNRGAYAEGERKDRGKGKSRVTENLPERKAEIL